MKHLLFSWKFSLNKKGDKELKFPYIVFKWQLLITSLQSEFLFFHLYIHLIFVSQRCTILSLKFSFFAGWNIKKQYSKHAYTRRMCPFILEIICQTSVLKLLHQCIELLLCCNDIRSCQVIIKGNIQECKQVVNVYKVFIGYLNLKSLSKPFYSFNCFPRSMFLSRKCKNE